MRRHRLLCPVLVSLALRLAQPCLLAQQPQAQAQPLVGVNAKWVNGVAPGYYPQALGAVAAPSAPGLSSSPGGVLAGATYYVKLTYVNAGGQSVPSSEASLAVALDNVLVVASPAASGSATSYNVYVSTTAGTETKQNATSITLGTGWTEPTSGLVSGASPPSSDTSWKTLSLGPGTAACGSPLAIDTYAGGQLALTASTTNYVYLDISASCAPTANTTGFTVTSLPLAVVITGTGSVTSIADDRGIFLGNYVSGGITGLNGLTASIQLFATGTTGTDLNIVSSVGTHTFNLPDASATSRGALNSTDWSTFNGKQDALSLPLSIANGGTGSGSGAGLVPITTVLGLSLYAVKGQVAGVTDGESATDCTVGSSSTAVFCQYDGSAWIAVGGGAGGVASLNTLTGALSLTSTDSSVTITPSGSMIDLSASGGSGTTTGGAAQVLAGPIKIPNSSIQFRVVTPNDKACTTTGNGLASAAALPNCQIAQKVTAGDYYVALYNMDRAQTSGGVTTCTLGDSLGNTWSPIGPALGTREGQIYAMMATTGGSSDTITPNATTCSPVSGHRYNQAMIIVQVFNSAGPDVVPASVSDGSCPYTSSPPYLGKCSESVTTTYPHEAILTFSVGAGTAYATSTFSAVNSTVLSRGVGTPTTYLLSAQGVANPGSTTVQVDSSTGEEMGFMSTTFLPESIIPTPIVFTNGTSAITYPTSTFSITTGHTYLAYVYSGLGNLETTGTICGLTDTLSNYWTFLNGYGSITNSEHRVEILSFTASSTTTDAFASSDCTNLPTTIMVADITATGGYETYTRTSGNYPQTLTTPTQAENDLVLAFGSGHNGSFAAITSSPNLLTLAAASSGTENYYAGVGTISRAQENSVTLSGSGYGLALVALAAPNFTAPLVPRRLVDVEQGITGQTVADAATVNFDAQNGQGNFYLLLSQNTTVGGFYNFDDGKAYRFNICEDGTGGWTLTLPSYVNYSPVINTAAGACTVLSGTFNGPGNATNPYGEFDFGTNQGQLSASQITNTFDVSTHNNLGLNYFDIGKIGPAPANPATGYDRIYADTGTGNLTCITSIGGACIPTASGANATQLQGVDVSAAAPSDTNVLAYKLADSAWEPSAVGTSAMVKLAQTVVTTPVATVTFSSISGAYTNLLLVVQGRVSDSALSEFCGLQFNSDTGSNYDRQYTQGANSTASAAATAGATSMLILRLAGATATAGSASTFHVWINNYAATAFYKYADSSGAMFPTSATTSTYARLDASGEWRNAAAITSITVIDSGGGNFETGSTFSLYGVN